MIDYLAKQTQQYFPVPIMLVNPVPIIEITDKDGELLGVLEDMGGDYQLRIHGEFITMIEKSTASWV